MLLCNKLVEMLEAHHDPKNTPDKAAIIDANIEAVLEERVSYDREW